VGPRHHLLAHGEEGEQTLRAGGDAEDGVATHSEHETAEQ
jgi:hypothetical protein